MENFENEEVENKELVVTENSNYEIMDFSGIGGKTETKTQVITNITDEKKIFNLENNVDLKLNDCVGETIRVKQVLIKRYEKPLKEPIIDEDTGEVIKDKTYTMSCVIVDEEDKSYATGSKVFTIQLMKYLQLLANRGKQDEMFDIKITKKTVGEKGNKALSFELI